MKRKNSYLSFLLLLLTSFIFCSNSLAADRFLTGQLMDSTPKLKPGTTLVQNFKPAITLPEKVAFEAITTGEHSNPSSPIRFDAVNYNDGNAFSLSGNEFVIPTSGLYYFSVNLTWNGFGCSYGVGGAESVTVMKNRREGIQTFEAAATNSTVGGFSTAFSFSTKLRAGDRITLSTVQLICDAGSGALPILLKAVFSGYRIYSD